MSGTQKSAKLSAVTALALGLALVLAPQSANAGDKEYFSETYRTDKPMNGYSGHAGAYYCDYQKQPNRVCTVDKRGIERCVTKGWILRQHCY